MSVVEGIVNIVVTLILAVLFYLVMKMVEKGKK